MTRNEMPGTPALGMLGLVFQRFPAQVLPFCFLVACGGSGSEFPPPTGVGGSSGAGASATGGSGGQAGAAVAVGGSSSGGAAGGGAGGTSAGAAGASGGGDQLGSGGTGASNAAGAPSTSGASSAGVAGTAGAAGAAGAPNTAPDNRFTLLFRDDFESLDTSRWQLMTHSWDTNLALFSARAVSVANGAMTLSLTTAPAGTVDGNLPKSFLGAEVRSRAALTYGRVRARAKLASGSAVVSALVTFYTPWPADNWNELDIECLGAVPGEVQFNAMVYTGAPVQQPATSSVSPTQDPKKVQLGFDPSLDFHVYTVEWTPESARFLVDEQVLHTWTKNISLMTLPQNVLLTIWASNSPEWAGPVNEATGRASMVYDWVELYRYAPQ